MSGLRFVGPSDAGRLPGERLLTDRLRLADINGAFDRLAAGAAVRQVVFD